MFLRSINRFVAIASTSIRPAYLQRAYPTPLFSITRLQHPAADNAERLASYKKPEIEDEVMQVGDDIDGEDKPEKKAKKKPHKVLNRRSYEILANKSFDFNNRLVYIKLERYSTFGQPSIYLFNIWTHRGGHAFMIDEAQRFVESLEAYDGDSEFSRRWSGYTMTRASKKTPAGNELEFIEINRQGGGRCRLELESIPQVLESFKALLEVFKTRKIVQKTSIKADISEKVKLFLKKVDEDEELKKNTPPMVQKERMKIAKNIFLK